MNAHMHRHTHILEVTELSHTSHDSKEKSSTGPFWATFFLSHTHTHTNPEIGVFFVCLTKCIITYKIRYLDATFSRCSSAAPLQLNAKGENDFLRSTVVRIICFIVHHKLVVHKVKAVRLRLIRVKDHFTHYGGIQETQCYILGPAKRSQTNQQQTVAKNI